jgi:hypothetical protein
MTAALRMPHEGIDAEGLLAAAEGMATEAARYQDVLVQEAHQADFVAQLRAAADAYRQAIDSRGQFRAQRHGATQSIDRLDRRATKLLTTISVLVTRALRDNPAAQAEWEQLKRVKKVASGTPGAGVPDAPVATTTVPVVDSATAAVPAVSSATAVVPVATPAAAGTTPAGTNKVA